MAANAETATSVNPSLNILLLNPKLLPEWFWLPTAYNLEAEGHRVFIPDLPRCDIKAGVRDDVEAISQTMGDLDNQFMVSLSGGVESGIRYLHKLRRENKLSRVLGWMVISSLGPQGYEVSPLGLATDRHAREYTEGISVDQSGFETLDPAIAKQYLLYDIDDEWLRNYTSENLIRQRPLTPAEVKGVPHLPHGLLPIRWYIGLNDKVDNKELSAAVAEQSFGVEPTYTNWGHVGPLSHTDAVTEAILTEAQTIYTSSLPEPLRRKLVFEDPLYNEQPDSFMYMMLRRTINENYAEHPVDFNLEGLRAAQHFFAPRKFTRQDCIADIGSSSGQFIAAAAEKTGIGSHVVGIEPDEDTFAFLPPEYKDRISMIKGYGEEIPLPANSIKVVTAHNVAFRSGNLFAMLSEMRRIAEPGGFIAISTNAKGHAHERHRYERLVADEVAKLTGIGINVPTEPAEGCYLEDLPAIIEEVDGLEIIDKLNVQQNTHAIITPERLDVYLDSIVFSYNRTNMPWWPHSKIWREVTYSIVKPDIERKIEEQAESDRRKGIIREPFFADTIKRGMIAIVNKVPALD